MKLEVSTLAKRLVNLALILPLLIALGLAAYWFGPRPARGGEPQVAVAAPALAPAAPVPSQKPAAPPVSQLLELFGMYQTAVGKGRAPIAPAAYLSTIEARYRQRGYRNLDELSQECRTDKVKCKTVLSQQSNRARFFQRQETNGLGNISATGEDADYNSPDRSAAPFTFVTLVAPAENGGAEWATYRMGMDREKQARLSSLGQGDFPGSDPADIPRLPGLQRIYAFSSEGASLAIYKNADSPVSSLIARYLDAMARAGWRLDTNAAPQPESLAPGAMFFTKAARSCLIWIALDKDQTANVTISCH